MVAYIFYATLQTRAYFSLFDEGGCLIRGPGFVNLSLLRALFTLYIEQVGHVSHYSQPLHTDSNSVPHS